MRYVLLGLIVLLCGGCAIYQAQTIDEYVAMVKATEGSGCIYVRGNSRPYADVSMLAIMTWGQSAPKYLDCLQAIPEAARTLAP